MQTLPALTSLKLTGDYTPANIATAMRLSGAQLRKLYLSTKLDGRPSQSYLGIANLAFLQQLPQSCPQLEELDLGIVRSEGSASEFALYRALGQFASLKRVHLSIYGAQSFLLDDDLLTNVNDRAIDKLAPNARDTANLESAFTDLAIDEQLAQSVFACITEAKPAFSPPLENLTLRVRAFDRYARYQSYAVVMHLLTFISRSCVCTSTLRDDRPHQCMVKECDEEDGAARDDFMDDVLEAVMALQPTLRRVWPDVTVDEWTQRWHSFPLAT